MIIRLAYGVLGGVMRYYSHPKLQNIVFKGMFQLYISYKVQKTLVGV